VVQFARVSVRQSPCGEVRVRLITVDDRAAVAAGANLSIALNSKTAEKRVQSAGFGVLAKGVRRFTATAKNKIRDCTAVLEEKYGTSCWFITLTLPGSTRGAIAACAAWASYIMERVRQYLRDVGFPNEVVAVWELQRRGALHMHVALPRVQGETASPVPYGLHHMWCNVLEKISVQCGVDLFERSTGGTWRFAWNVVRTDIQKTTTSVARYLSKYMSKGNAGVAAKHSFYPTRWWSVSRKLSDSAAAQTRLWVSPIMSITTCLECYEKMGGTICGAGTGAFAIVNVYRPTAKALSIWGTNRDVIPVIVTAVAANWEQSARTWYDSAASHDREPPLPDRNGGSHFCWRTLDWVTLDIIHPCTCASHLLHPQS